MIKLDIKYRCALGFMALLALIPLHLFSQPRIFVEKKQIDLGVVYNGSTATADVTIKNTGNESLRINSIRTSCGCTKVREPKDLLKPGESDLLQIGFDATGFRGPIVKYVSIDTNDPQNPSYSLTISAEVKEEVVAKTNSSVMWLGNLSTGKRTKHSLTFKNISNRSINITSASTNSNSISVQLNKKKLAPRDSISVNVTIVPQQEGYFSGEFILHTDSPNQTRIPMRISYIATR